MSRVKVVLALIILKTTRELEALFLLSISTKVFLIANRSKIPAFVGMIIKSAKSIKSGS